VQPAPALIACGCWNPSACYCLGGWPITKTIYCGSCSISYWNGTKRGAGHDHGTRVRVSTVRGRARVSVSTARRYCGRTKDVVVGLSKMNKIAEPLTEIFNELWTLHTTDTSDPGHFGTSLVGPNRTVQTDRHWCQSVLNTVRHCPKDSSDLSAELSCPSCAINSRRSLLCCGHASPVPSKQHTRRRHCRCSIEHSGRQQSHAGHTLDAVVVCLSVRLSHAGYRVRT